MKMFFSCQYFSGEILEVQAGELRASMMNASSVALSTVYIDVFLNYIQKDILPQVQMEDWGRFAFLHFQVMWSFF